MSVSRTKYCIQILVKASTVEDLLVAVLDVDKRSFDCAFVRLVDQFLQCVFGVLAALVDFVVQLLATRVRVELEQVLLPTGRIILNRWFWHFGDVLHVGRRFVCVLIDF